MRVQLLAVSAALALTAATAACSPSASKDQSQASAGQTTVTVRIWDDQVLKPYQASFDAFTKANPDIAVKINLVPFADYFTKLRSTSPAEGSTTSSGSTPRRSAHWPTAGR